MEQIARVNTRTIITNGAYLRIDGFSDVTDLRDYV